MTSKIFHSIFSASIAVLLVTLLIVAGSMGAYFESVQEQELQDELKIAAAATEKLGSEYLEELEAKRYRLTWISEKGEILYDSVVDAATMDNHLDREEVRKALNEGIGSSSRYSATLMEKTLYEAKRLCDGSVLRISVSYLTALYLVLGMLYPLVIIFIAAAILSLILAIRMAKKIVKPFNHLDLAHPLANDTYEELSPLLKRINVQQEQIDQQLTELAAKQEEFKQITARMEEGLVLLDDQAKIRSINPAAKAIFMLEDACLGQDFCALKQNTALNTALKKVQTQAHETLRLKEGGREYQINISRIDAQALAAYVLLVFDVTEEAKAEERRREFSANVSHELKTPLQSIIGSAELIENGLMKKEDIPNFAGKIRKEALRLVNLIDDIIRLSRLDEGKELPKKEVDLAKLSKEVLLALQSEAARKKVELSVKGQATLFGVERLLFAILYNLGDNAIKYNIPNGKVEIILKEEKEQVIIKVRDTGIGIPPTQQSRIFERFYRVDKSHSKESGGTGLGLSIVKHAVLYHQGTIEVKSQEGSGTEISVTLPKSSQKDN